MKYVPRPPSRLYDLTVSEHNRQVYYPVFHGAVSHGVCAAAICAYHTPDHGCRAWIDGKEESLVFDLLVESHPGNGWLDDHVHTTESFSPRSAC